MPEKCDRSGATLSDYAVKRRPAPHADADRGDLVLGRRAVDSRRLVGPRDPDADAVLARFARDAERAERVDQPAFERGDEGAHVGAAALEVEHDIGHPLARPVIGELAAAPGAIDGKARVEEVGRLGAGAGRVERRVLDQPDALGGASLRRSPRRALPSPPALAGIRRGRARRAIRPAASPGAAGNGARSARRVLAKAKSERREKRAGQRRAPRRACQGRRRERGQSAARRPTSLHVVSFGVAEREETVGRARRASPWSRETDMTAPISSEAERRLSLAPGAVPFESRFVATGGRAVALRRRRPGPVGVDAARQPDLECSLSRAHSRPRRRVPLRPAARPRGVGLSTPPPGFSFRAADHARLIAAAIERLDWRDATLVAHDGAGRSAWARRRRPAASPGCAWATPGPGRSTAISTSSGSRS